MPRPAIHMYCVTCESEQTFNMTNSYDEVDYSAINNAPDKVFRLRYLCSACERQLRFFFIYVYEQEESLINSDTGEEEVETVLYVKKVGQFPSWSIAMNKSLEKELGIHAELYRRGLENESQGYGIGAFAYFRRITETIIDDLLDSVAEILEGEDKVRYDVALAETKKTTVTQDKIDLVKDLLPTSLRPDGMNPLGILHSALSEGLHAETDAECLEYADEVKGTLIYLVNQIERSRSASRSFTESMRKILNKRAERGGASSNGGSAQ